MIAQVTAEMVAEIVESVFITMMELDVSLGDAIWIPSLDRLTASVRLSGDWNGAVLLECDRWQACQFAGRFLSIDPPDTVNEDVRDVLGELTNMIGGNLKSVVAMGLSLSMPSITDGNECGLAMVEGEVQDRLAFQCADGTFWVTLLATK
jgi:chemotaxis protein CheX